MPADPVRDSAVSALLRVLDGQAHIDVTVDRIIRKGNTSARGARFLTHLVYGVTRHKLLCDHVLQGLCEQPLDKLPPPVLMILRMGIFQALFCDTVTRPAMVHTSVELARKRAHAGLARVVNAVLRRAPQRIEDIALPDKEQDLANYLRLRYSMPRWMVRLWLGLYGQDGAERLCMLLNEPAPIALRANTLKTDRDTLFQQLTDAGYAVEKMPDMPEALLVSGADRLLRGKLFQDGHFMVQDPASMLAAHLVAPTPGERILDLCAAPGGKTTHMAALADNQARIVALERYAGRAHLIHENRARLGAVGVEILCGDGLTPPFCDGCFDKVLIDAPCSGLGVLRRHPEIKWRITPDAPARLAATQLALLRKAVQLCKNGGLIVYSVCTLTQEETFNVASELMAQERCVPEDGLERFNSWKITQGQYQTNPLDAAWDGFFLTRFRKQS